MRRGRRGAISWPAPSGSSTQGSARYERRPQALSPRDRRVGASRSPRCTPSSSISADMHWIDWTILGVYLVWIVWDGLRLTKKVERARRLLSRQPQHPVVGGRVVGDGDAAVGHHDDRHHRAGLRRRHALHPVLLRAADRDDHPVGHARAVLSQRARVHRLRVSRTPLRRQDAVVHGVAVPDLARHGVRRGHLGAGRGALGDHGRQRHHHLPADGRADRDLHDVRRRPGGDVDRRQADVSDRLRPARGVQSRCSSACPTRSASPMR